MCFPRRAFSRGLSVTPFAKSIAAGYVLFCVPKENQKGRRCPQGMKAPVGLLSRRPVCKANAACSARQGLRYFRGAGGGDTLTAADAASRYDLSREKVTPKRPQSFRSYKIQNMISADDATATTAACGRSREELLGPWPAGCKARSRAVAAAGCHNSSKAKRRAF